MDDSPVGHVVGDHAAAEADALQALKYPIHHSALALHEVCQKAHRR